MNNENLDRRLFLVFAHESFIISDEASFDENFVSTSSAKFYPVFFHLNSRIRRSCFQGQKYRDFKKRIKFL